MFLPLEEINIGVVARNMLDDFISQNHEKLDKSTIKSESTELLLNARNFIIEPCLQIKKRVDFNDKFLQSLSSISPATFDLMLFRNLGIHD